MIDVRKSRFLIDLYTYKTGKKIIFSNAIGGFTVRIKTGSVMSLFFVGMFSY